MKYLVLIPDGAADRPSGGRTPLELAKTPYLDSVTKEGLMGLARTIPKGFGAGSDVGIMTLLGYNPIYYYPGRAPIEIASKGIDIPDDAIVFRMNLVTVSDDEIMLDHSASHISDEEAEEAVKLIKERFETEGVSFYTGKSYRNFMVVRGMDFSVKCIPPHDIIGKRYGRHLPEGKGSSLLRKIMLESREILNPVGKANMVWLWGDGKKAKFESFESKFGVKAGIISAVDLVRGLGVLAGMKVIEVEGITGYIDTNWDRKAEAAVEALQELDLVLVHVEAPDETSHEGSLEKKVKSIELFDEKIVGGTLNRVKGDVRILVACDHRTPLEIRTHSDEPVPFMVWPYKGSLKGRRFCEEEAKNTGLFAFGTEVIKLLWAF